MDNLEPPLSRTEKWFGFLTVVVCFGLMIGFWLALYNLGNS